MASVLAGEKLRSGYAETSTKRWPKEPTTVVVGEAEVRAARCLGAATMPDGLAGWLVFKMPGKRRYYFQYRPW